MVFRCLFWQKASKSDFFFVCWSGKFSTWRMTPQKKISIWRIFIGRLAVCLISVWHKYTKVMKSSKIWPKMRDITPNGVTKCPWKSFFEVSHITSRICLIDIRRKSLFLLFLDPNIPLKSSDMTSKHPEGAKIMPFEVKILRENMWDVLFLDVFNQANFKYSAKKKKKKKKKKISVWWIFIGWLGVCLISAK